MDEPTNHLDIQSKEIIKLALQNYDGTLIVISHDREFLQGLCDKIFEFRNGQMKEFLGNIDEYLEYRQKESIREISAEKAKLDQKQESKIEQKNIEKEITKPTNFISKEQKQLQNRIKKVEEKIAKLEENIAELEKTFSKINPTEEQLHQYNQFKEELKNTTEEWENLILQIEE